MSGVLGMGWGSRCVSVTGALCLCLDLSSSSLFVAVAVTVSNPAAHLLPLGLPLSLQTQYTHTHTHTHTHTLNSSYLQTLSIVEMAAAEDAAAAGVEREAEAEDLLSAPSSEAARLRARRRWRRRLPEVVPVVRAVVPMVEVATTAVAMRMRIVLAATSGGPWTKTPSILNVQ